MLGRQFNPTPTLMNHEEAGTVKVKTAGFDRQFNHVHRKSREVPHVIEEVYKSGMAWDVQNAVREEARLCLRAFRVGR